MIIYMYTFLGDIYPRCEREASRLSVSVGPFLLQMWMVDGPYHLYTWALYTGGRDVR